MPALQIWIEEKLVEGCHVCCSVRRAIHFVKRKIMVEESFGLAVRRLNPNTTIPPAACSIFLSAFREKVMKALKKIEQAAWAWQVMVRVRWQRVQCRVAALYYRRVTFPVRMWRACGCPAQFRPRRALHRLALVWLLRDGLFLALLGFGPLLLAWLFGWGR